jgi:peptidoglycan/LPS O-acetylase OafA/YrhL
MRALSSTRHSTDNFDSLRFLAAAAVLVSHSFTLVYGPASGVEPLLMLSRGQTTLGTAAVLVFFVISGYLVSESFHRHPDALRFLGARILRIFPGLLACLLLSALVLGPSLTTLPLVDYFGATETLWYVPANLSLHWIQLDLPGVFQGNPIASVNTSLWTLEYEVACYGAVLLLGVSRLLTRQVAAVVLVLALIASWRWLGGTGDFWSIFGSAFAAGAALHLWRHRVPLDGRLALASAAVLCLSLATGGFRLAFATAGAYLVIYLARTPVIRLPRFARYGDLSYGMYLYAFPVEQTVVHFLRSSATWYWVVAVSTPLALALAKLSWQFVEGPALALKGEIASRPLERAMEARATVRG